MPAEALEAVLARLLLQAIFDRLNAPLREAARQYLNLVKEMVGQYESRGLSLFELYVPLIRHHQAIESP